MQIFVPPADRIGPASTAATLPGIAALPARARRRRGPDRPRLERTGTTPLGYALERSGTTAPGHALDLAARRPGSFSRVLIATTSRGPLPTMMKRPRPIQGRIRRLVRAPVVSEALYRLNVSRLVVRAMWPGARFAAACFVTGALDPCADRDA